MRKRELAIDQLNPEGAFEIGDMMAGGPAATARKGRASLEASRPTHEDLEARWRRWRKTPRRRQVLRSCELGLGRVASGIRCWGYSRAMTRRQHFPPSGVAMLAGSAYFSARSIYQQNLLRLARTRMLLGKPWNGRRGRFLRRPKDWIAPGAVYALRIWRYPGAYSRGYRIATRCPTHLRRRYGLAGRYYLASSLNVSLKWGSCAAKKWAQVRPSKPQLR